MEKSYAIISQKGGTGKTTTSLTLAAGLSLCGKRVLLIDADQQGDATRASNIKAEKSLADIFEKKCKPEEAIQKTDAGYDIIPSIGSALTVLETKTKLMSKLLKAVCNDYDFVIIDCPPNIGELTMEALQAVDEVIFPATTDEFCLNAFRQMAESVRSVRETKNKKLKFAGILIVKDHVNYGISKSIKEIFESMADENGTKVFDTKIPENVAIREAQSKHISLFEYVELKKEKENPAAAAYENFILELTGVKLTKKRGGKESAKKENESGGNRNVSRGGVPEPKGRKVATGRKKGWKATGRR